MNRRIYFITGSDLKVFEWHGQNLYASYEFSDSSEQLAELDDYLASAPIMLSYLLVDLLDEDFQHEKIPHLRGRDKKSVIKRQIQKHFRDATYTFTRIVGRDKAGRRDDELLLTSVTNSDVLDQWIKILNRHSVPIIGIWSLPLLSEDLLPYLSKNATNFLLVSRQVDNVLRESFFKSRKLYLSRHIKTDRGENDEISLYLSKGIEQIHKFLSNQRVIPFGQKMDVFCLIPTDLVDKAKTYFPNTDALTYHFKDLGELYKLNKLSPDLPQNADILFSYLCSKRFLGSDQYGTNKFRKSFYRYLLEKSFYLTSTFGAILLLAFSALFHISAQVVIKDTADLDRTTFRLEKIYQVNYAELERDLGNADLIQQSVEFHQTLLREANTTPENIFSPISSVLDQPEFSAITLETISWVKMFGPELDRLRQEIWRATTPNLTAYSEYEYNEGEADDKIPVVTLIGSLASSNLEYRSTVQTMENFVKALEKLPEVVQLSVVTTPVDIRITSRFTDQGGVDRTLQANTTTDGQYQIQLLLKPSQPDPVGDHE